MWVVYNGLIKKGMFICHKCDNPGCVKPDHLFLGTASDNNMDKIKKNRHNAPSGEGHANSKLTAKQVQEIRSLKGVKSSYEVGKLFNISYGNVCVIWRGETWK